MVKRVSNAPYLAVLVVIFLRTEAPAILMHVQKRRWLLNEKRPCRSPDRAASLKNSSNLLRDPWGNFSGPEVSVCPEARFNLRTFTSVLVASHCHNRDSIHRPVEHGENHHEDTMKTPNGEPEPKSEPRISYMCDGCHTILDLNFLIRFKF